MNPGKQKSDPVASLKEMAPAADKNLRNESIGTKDAAKRLRKKRERLTTKNLSLPREYDSTINNNLLYLPQYRVRIKRSPN